MTTHSALVWKRQANENQQSAKLLARASIALLVILLAAGAYAFATRARLADLCSTLQHTSEQAPIAGERKLAADLAASYCT